MAEGLLGGFLRVYCDDSLTGERVIDAIGDVPGLERVLGREAVWREFDLPFEPEGDVAVFGDARTVMGTRALDHDLGGLKGEKLRTRGSTNEADAPVILSRPLNDEDAAGAAKGHLHSCQVFDYAFDGTMN